MKDHIGGIVSLVIGLIVLFSVVAQAITTLIIIVGLGLWIVVTGIVRIINSFYVRKANKELPEDQRKKTWVLLLIFGILVLALGIFALANLGVLIIATGILVGLEVIFAGANALVSGIVYKKPE